MKFEEVLPALREGKPITTAGSKYLTQMEGIDDGEPRVTWMNKKTGLVSSHSTIPAEWLIWETWEIAE